MRYLVLAALAAALLLPTSASAAPGSRALKHQVAALRTEAKRLRAANVRLTAANDKLNNALSTAQDERGTANQTVATLAPQANKVAGLEAENSRLTTENTGLKGALPDQVAAVAKNGNLSQLFDLVILPARRNWSCGGSSFFGSTFYSVDFNAPGFCF